MRLSSSWIAGILTVFTAAASGFEPPATRETPATPAAVPISPAIPDSPCQANGVIGPAQVFPFVGQCVVTTIEPRKGCSPSDPGNAVGSSETSPDSPSLFWVYKTETDKDQVIRGVWVVGRSSGWVSPTEIKCPRDAVESIRSELTADGSDECRYLSQGLMELVRPDASSSGPNFPAIADFTAALRRDPCNQSAYYHRALAYAQSFMKEGKSLPDGATVSPEQQRALGDLTEALRLDRASVRALLARAAVLKAMGWKEQSQADFESVLVLEPKNCVARDGLSSLHLAVVDPYQGALDKAQREASEAKDQLAAAKNVTKNVQGQLDTASNDLKDATQKLGAAQGEVTNAKKALEDHIKNDKDPLNQANAAAALADANAKADLSRAQAMAAIARAEKLEAKAKEESARAAKAQHEAATVLENKARDEATARALIAEANARTAEAEAKAREANARAAKAEREAAKNP